jgi:hypothetical protein
MLASGLPVADTGAIKAEINTSQSSRYDVTFEPQTAPTQAVHSQSLNPASHKKVLEMALHKTQKSRSPEESLVG